MISKNINLVQNNIIIFQNDVYLKNNELIWKILQVYKIYFWNFEDMILIDQAN